MGIGFEVFKTFVDLPRNDRRYISDEDLISPWQRLMLKIREAPGPVDISIGTRDFYVDSTEVSVGVSGEEIIRFTVDHKKWLNDRNYPMSETYRRIEEWIDKRLEDLDWNTYFDDLWYMVYADGRPDELITRQVSPEEFSGVYTEKRFREIYNFPPKKGN